MYSFTIAALVSAAAAISADELSFMNYAATFNKIYEDVEEFALRLERFKHNDRLINEHNATNGHNFTLGNNHFSDWKPEEYGDILGYVLPKKNDDENDYSEV